MAAQRALTTLLAVILVATPVGVLADKGGKGKGGNPHGPPGAWVDDGVPGKGNKGGRAEPGAAGVLIGTNDRRIIQDYFRLNPYPAQGLPPGIAKNLARGKPLPPGIAKQQLPSDLVRLLPPVYPGYERIVVDGRVLLVDIATQMIHDVLMEAVFH